MKSIGFNHVLVAIDFSRPAIRAEELAIDLAERFGAKVTLLFVVSLPDGAYHAGSFSTLDGLVHEAELALDTEKRRVQAKFARVECVVRTGTVWEEILAVAREMGADLIALGTRGRRGLPHALLGSVAEKVVRMATVPVLTVAGSEDEAPTA